MKPGPLNAFFVDPLELRVLIASLFCVPAGLQPEARRKTGSTAGANVGARTLEVFDG